MKRQLCLERAQNLSTELLNYRISSHRSPIATSQNKYFVRELVTPCNRHAGCSFQTHSSQSKHVLEKKIISKRLQLLSAYEEIIPRQRATEIWNVFICLHMKGRK